MLYFPVNREYTLYVPMFSFDSISCLIDSSRETEKLCPHPLGHQPAAQSRSAFSSPVTPPPPPFRCQSGSSLFRRRAWAHQLRRQQEVDVCASPAPQRSPQQRLQWRGGAGPLWLRVTGRLRQATCWTGCLLGCLPQPCTLQLKPAA